MKLLLSAAMVLGIASSAFAGNYAYNNNVAVRNKVVVDQKIVEFDARYFLGVPGYYSTLNAIEEERQTEDDNALKAENQTLRAQIELLIKLCNGNHPATPAPAPSPAPKPTEPATPPVTPTEPAPTGPNTGGDGDNGGYEVTALDEKAYEIFKNKCASCHAENGSKGDWGTGEPVVLYKKATDTLVLQPLENRALIHEVTRRVGLDDKGLSAMPPGGPLPDADVEVLYQWMQEEATRYREGK
jgi:mono/diheme cytochrome c family protein